MKTAGLPHSEKETLRATGMGRRGLWLFVAAIVLGILVADRALAGDGRMGELAVQEGETAQSGEENQEGEASESVPGETPALARQEGEAAEGAQADPGEEHSGEEHSGEEHAAGEEHAEGDDHAHGDHANVSNFDYFLSQSHLLGHTQDSDHFLIPSFNNGSGPALFGADTDPNRLIHIPHISPWSDESPLMAEPEGELSQFLGNITFQPTKFIVVELIAAVIVFLLFTWLARRVATGDAPRGRLWNALEAAVVYIRDEVARPSVGSHDYKHFTPFLLTIFFFVLTMNLLGMFPLFGAATGCISITASLALAVFAMVLWTGSRKLGVVGFWKAQAPHIDVQGPLKPILVVGIWCIEVFGLFIKHMVLAVRLFANMFAGHLVLAVLVGFIGAMWGTYMNWIVIPGVIGSSLALNVLELLVAFIQAYVFTFLSALFIGAAVHPH